MCFTLSTRLNKKVVVESIYIYSSMQRYGAVRCRILNWKDAGNCTAKIFK